MGYLLRVGIPMSVPMAVTITVWDGEGDCRDRIGVRSTCGGCCGVGIRTGIDVCTGGMHSRCGAMCRGRGGGGGAAA